MDRKVRRGRERLAQDVEVTPPAIPAEKSEQLLVLEEKIKKLLEQVETLGEAGKVDEAEALMRKVLHKAPNLGKVSLAYQLIFKSDGPLLQVDMLNAEKTALTLQSNDKTMILPQEKKMALCEICGSFLVANDAAERTQSHVTGKQHIGYGMVRDFLNEFKVRFLY